MSKLELPSGTVTFLFTDIEGSTQLWEKNPEEMKSALAKHDAILKTAIESNHGHIIKTTGDGVHAVFTTAIDAINAAIAAQSKFKTSEFSKNSEVLLHVRMGFHTGEAELRENDYYGQSLNRAARIMGVGHGGQILLSGITTEVVREHLPANTSLQDLGDHRLKDLIRPERIFQLNAPDLPNNFPALKSLNTLPNNLPNQLTSFIGREREMSEAERLISSSHLLTLVGPGGTGKTRLSLQLAAEQFSKFKDGIWFIELAPLANSDYIIPAIASVFDLREVRNISFTNILLDYLRAKQILLIFDNCEHLIEASAQIASQILQTCSQVKIVASSREALGIEGETVFRVPSLIDTEATRLFVERATKAESRFKLTENNASSIAQICSRLDGIPLAIELAAARVKLFTPEQIAERLDDRFKLLTGGSRTALPRQQTLHALIDWSYQTLNETEQKTLRSLAVFSGGWTFEAAESVIGANEAMDGLVGLVNKSLVNVEEHEGQSRYRFLETIRQYALEKLIESGEAVDARNHHLDFILQLAEESEGQMFGAESVEWLDQMEIEHDNLRAALEWAVSNHIEKAIRLAIAVGGFWTTRDYSSEARNWCKTILEHSQLLHTLNNERAKMYAIWGWSAITTGNHKEGLAAAEIGLALAKQAEDKKYIIVRLLSIIGLATMFSGDPITAMAIFEECILMARQNEFKGELAIALTAHAQSNFFTKKDLALAEKYLREAVILGKEAGYHWASDLSMLAAGRLAGTLGDLETARQRFVESAEISKKIGNKRMAYSSRSEFAHVLREHGKIDEALEIYREVLPQWKELGHRAAVAHELECIAYILIKKEEPESAGMLLGAAEVLRKAIDTNMTNLEVVEYEKEISSLRKMLGEDEYNRRWLEGQKLTIDDAIELALSDKHG
ncbi:MAG: adenylate/guanylate cyclase domain-containing protein [Anaerolineales bacterium]|nr:adenylate/guanylate cyclase domain-containing protein [Anaerolineales bacterium]